jgi:uncharacterized Zn-finger protein
MRIHNGEKNFQCDFENCSSKFRTSGQLKDHVNSHFNIKNYKCQICESTFTRKASLTKHFLIHRRGSKSSKSSKSVKSNKESTGTNDLSPIILKKEMSKVFKYIK